MRSSKQIPRQCFISAPVAREDRERISRFAREKRVTVSHVIRAGVALLMAEPRRLPPLPRRPLDLVNVTPLRGAKGGAR